ncbi:hypothetical protein [Ferrimonas balearica]|uniref:hypothetical protein n=1 Tax=Ferrimonas balearica TaxID=44012 RepID=UPI001C9735B8|nr:hypothetical protein [Ferrimonas balearica]MBY5979543.1 hypothetical protein [Ferrimonas balearica]
MTDRINVDYFYKEVCDSDYDFMLKTINGFNEYSLSILNTLRELSEPQNKDRQEAVQLIHMFCGSIGLLGFAEQANELSQFENQLRQGAVQYDESLHNNVSRLVRAVSTELDKYLSIIKRRKDVW